MRGLNPLSPFVVEGIEFREWEGDLVNVPLLMGKRKEEVLLRGKRVQ